MKQVEKLIENLESKFKIKIESFLDLYERNASSELLQESLGITENTVRVITRTLNIRMPKKHRSNDLALLKSRFGDSAVSLDLQETKGDLEASYRDNLKLEKKLVEMRRELQKFKLVHKNQEVDFEEIRNAVLGTIRPVKPVEVKVLSKSSHFKNHTQLILLSDLHAEELVLEKDVGMTNSYDWEEFERRLDVVFMTALSSYRGEKKCILASMGDAVSGIIHNATESTSKYTGEAIAELARLLAKYTTMLAEVFEEVEVLGVTGNHSRLSEQRKAVANGFNLEYLMFELWKALAPKDNIKYSFGTSGYVTTVIADKVFGVHHGDYHKGGYGTTKTLKIQDAFRQATGLSPYHIAQGHLHIPMVECMHTGGQYITNGSMIGAGGYSHSNGFTAVPWSQTIGCFLPDGTLEYTRWISG